MVCIVVFVFVKFCIFEMVDVLFYDEGICVVGVDWFISLLSVIKVMFYKYYGLKECFISDYVDYWYCLLVDEFV